MFIFQNLKKFFWLYCTRKSVPPPLFTLSLPIQNKKPSKKPIRLGGLGKRNQFLEVELKLCSCLFLVVDDALERPGRLRGGWVEGGNVRIGKERGIRKRAGGLI